MAWKHHQPTGEAITLRYPTFTYSYKDKGKTYNGRSAQSVSKRHVCRMGETQACTIYLDPNQPATLITRKTIGSITFTELFMAATAFGATIWIAMSTWG